MQPGIKRVLPSPDEKSFIESHIREYLTLFHVQSQGRAPVE